MKQKYRILFLIFFSVVIGLSPFIYYFNYVFTGDWDGVLGGWEAVRKTILVYHQFPFWNPWHSGGTPLFANPGFGLFSIQSVCVLLFGSLYGVKITIIILLLIGAYGMYFMLGDYIKSDLARYWGAILFSLQGTLCIHLSLGHDVMIVIIWFPWIIYLVKRIKKSLSASLFFAVILSAIINSFIHYVSIMIFAVTAFFVIHQIIKNKTNLIFWKNIILSGLLFTSLSIYKVLISYNYFSQFPRLMNERVSIPLSMFIKALILPGQFYKSYPPFFINSNEFPGQHYFWYWHEFGSYIGLIAVTLFLIWFLKNYLVEIVKIFIHKHEKLSLKKLLKALFEKWWFWGAFITLMLALNSETKYLPGYWLREISVFKSMFAITRWRFFTVFFIIIGACFCMNSLVEKVKISQKIIIKIIPVILVIISFAGLTYNQYYCWTKTLKIDVASYLRSVPSTNAPIISSNEFECDFPTVHNGIARINSYEVMLGYMQDYRTARIPVEDKKNYRGEVFSLSDIPMKVQWSPNKITVYTPSANNILINQNPGNNWYLNGEQLFPELKSFDKMKLFILQLPEKGTYSLESKSPVANFARQLTLGFFALFIVFLYIFYVRKKQN